MKILFATALLFLLVLPCLTQTSQKNDELKFNADYFLMRNEFDKALEIYLRVFQSEPENADIMYRIGVCYLNSEDDKIKSIRYLYQASQNVSEKYNTNSFKEFHAPVEVYFLLGSAYRVNNQLDEAIGAYEKYKEYLNSKDKYNREVTDQYIRNCQLAKELLKKPHNVTFANLGSVINNKLANFNPVVSGDGKILAYTTTGKQGYDIFISSFNDTVWSAPKNITPVLGAGKYLKTSSLSYDGNTLLVEMEDPENSDLYVSHLKKGRWSKAEPLGKEINSKYNETNGSFSPDGKTIYFTSNRKGGEGDLDIYRSMLQGEVWSAAQNLGPEVNTPYNEETPFVSADNKELYFSSEGHNGMGGFDVYKFDLSNPHSEVINLGYPVNTTENNLSYVPLGDGNSAFYAFRGRDTYGGRDIYRVTVIPEVVEEPVITAAAEPVVPPAEKEAAAITPEPSVTAPESATAAPESSVAAPEAEAQAPAAVPVIAAPAAVIPEAVTLAPAAVVPAAATVMPAADTATPVADVVVPEAIADVPPPAENTPPAVEVMPEAAAVVPAETVPEPGTAKVAVAVKPEPVHNEPQEIKSEETEPEEMEGRARSYTIQFMALRKPVDLQYFRGLSDISLTLDKDAWYRYTWITTTDSVRATRLKNDLVSKGFTDAFIRRKSIIPRYTIQVMAVPGPVTDLHMFSNLPEISVRKDSDTFCRYTTGWFETRDDARNALAQVRSLGYEKAFVRKVKTLQ
jgi:tetratricopeptide (TPR) repeat protein